MKNVIILGATGGTGMHLARYLSERHYRVTGTGVSHRDAGYFGMDNVHYLDLDISKKEQFQALPTEDIHCVILLAGMMPSRMEGYDPYKYVDVNITGTLNVLEFCRENQIKKVIFAQSHADVYGHWNTGKHIPADAPRALNLRGDHAMYIISKCTAVDMLEHYNQEYGIQNIVLRLPTIYSYMPAATLYVDGVIQDMAFMYIVRKAVKGEQIEIWGDPAQPKDIVYIKDFLRIVECAIESSTASGIFNVGTGIGTTLEQQIRGIVEVFSGDGHKSEVIYCREKKSQASYLYDISKTEQELGYTVQYPYRDMLQDMRRQMLEEVNQGLPV